MTEWAATRVPDKGEERGVSLPLFQAIPLGDLGTSEGQLTPASLWKGNTILEKLFLNI